MEIIEKSALTYVEARNQDLLLDLSTDFFKKSPFKRGTPLICGQIYPMHQSDDMKRLYDEVFRIMKINNERIIIAYIDGRGIIKTHKMELKLINSEIFRDYIFLDPFYFELFLFSESCHWSAFIEPVNEIMVLSLDNNYMFNFIKKMGGEQNLFEIVKPSLADPSFNFPFWRKQREPILRY